MLFQAFLTAIKKPLERGFLKKRLKFNQFAIEPITAQMHSSQVLV